MDGFKYKILQSVNDNRVRYKFNKIMLTISRVLRCENIKAIQRENFQIYLMEFSHTIPPYRQNDILMHFLNA